jgi:hypothetical protein
MAPSAACFAKAPTPTNSMSTPAQAIYREAAPIRLCCCLLSALLYTSLPRSRLAIHRDSNIPLDADQLVDAIGQPLKERSCSARAIGKVFHLAQVLDSFAHQLVRFPCEFVSLLLKVVKRMVFAHPMLRGASNHPALEASNHLS